jgi:WS/DGAT/MGAT family acyltransferase
MALMQILLSLTDARDPAAAPAKPAHSHGTGGFSVADLVDPEQLIRLAKKGARGVESLGRILLLPGDSPSPIRGPLTSRKVATWSEPLAIPDLKTIARRHHATINDVLQASIAGALGRYLEGRGVERDGLEVRAVVPVDLRPPNRPPDTGNFFGLVFLELPVGIRDPVERLVETKRRMDRIKATPEAAAIFQLLHAIGYMSPRIEELALRVFGSKATAVMTNVPGPKEVRQLCGREIRDIMFWVPESGGLGVGVSFFSYRGRVRVGIVSDAGLAPDPAAIAAGFEVEVDRLAERPRAAATG